MGNLGTGSRGNEDLMFSLGLDGVNLVDQLDQAEQKTGESLKKIGGHFKDFKDVVDSAATSNAFKNKITSMVGPVSTLTTELRALVSQLRQVNSLLTGMSGAGAPAIIKATGNAAAAATVASGKAAAASIAATGQASAAATAAAGKASAAATVATAKAAALAAASASKSNAAATRTANAAAAAAKKVGLSGQTLNQQFQQTGGYLRNISTVLSTLGLGGGIFALIYGFKQLVKDGIEINSQIEQAKISLAAEVVASSKMVEVDGQRVEGLRAMKAVQGQVGEIVGQLKTDALFVNGTFEDLLGIAQSITPQVARMGGSLTQVHRLTQLTGIAASVLNVEFKTAQTGLSQLLNGNVVGRNAFVRRLPIPVDELKAGLKDVNGRAEFLIKTLAKLEDAGPLIMTSFKGALESMKDLLQQVSGRAFEPLGKRLQGGFNSFISTNVLKGADGTMQYSQDLEATITRVSRLVDTLLGQVVMVARELFGNTGGVSFLSVAEQSIPKIVGGLANLLSFLGQVGGFLMQHADIVLKLIGYYLTFNITVGVFRSLQGIVLKVNGAMVAMQSLLASASGSTMTLTGAVGMLSGALKSLATKFVIGLLVVAVMEMISHFMDARQAAADMKLALDDLNTLNFDSAITQIRKLTQEIKDGEGWWDKLWSLGKTKKNAGDINNLTEKAVQKSFDVLSTLGIGTPVRFSGVAINPSTGKPQVQDTGLDSIDILGSARKIGQGIEIIRKQQDALQDEARTASDKRREDIKTELGDLAKKNDALRSALSLLKESSRAASALMMSEEGRKQLGGTKLALFGRAGEDVAAVEAGLNLSPRTVVTPNRSVTPPDEDAARRLLRNESALVSALEQLSQASSRVLDRNNQRQQSEMDLLVAKHVLTVQQAAGREIQIAKDTAAAKIGVQEKLFQKLNDNKLVDLAGAKSALGLGAGSLSFAELRGVSEEQVAQALANMQESAKTSGKTDQAEFQKQIHDLELLGKIVAAIHSEEEKLGGTIAENNRRREKADEDAINSGIEQASQMAERSAQLDVEQAKLFDIGTTLEDQLAREKSLTAEIVKQGKAAVDQKAQKEKDNNNEKTNWTPEQKTAANAVINAQADREKQFLDAKEQIALAQRIINLKDQELTLGQTGTEIREIELNTLKRILGAENPLVIRKQNELTIEKAKTLELKAQARFAAAKDLRGAGQNTAAREAEKQGEVLQAQANAMRQETANFLDVLTSGLSELSGLLGKFGSKIGSIGTDVGQMLGGISKISKAGGLGGLFSAGKGDATGFAGTAKGVMAVAGPIASIASSVIGVLSSLAGGSTQAAIDKIDKAATKFADSINDIVDGLRNHQKSLAETIAELEYQKTQVAAQIPHERVSWLSSLFGGQGKADTERQTKIDDAISAIDSQLKQLKQTAQDALHTLEFETLPALRVTPAMREFEASIETIRKELDNLAKTPGIKQSDLNELFNIRIADIQAGAMETLLDQKQEYLDILKKERDLKGQLTDLDKEQVQVEKDYTDQRAQILGLATRELSKSEQLAQLKKDKQAKLDDIAQRKVDLEAQLASVEKQKTVYESVFGVVQDIGKYEIDIQDQLLAKTQERLTSLQTFLNEIKEWMNSGMWNFITNNGQTTANGNPYALPVVLVNPQPISTPDPTNPGVSGSLGDQVNYNMYGDIKVNGNMTKADAKQSFLEAWRSFNQENTVRGLAHSNA